ncbi:MAG TPA: aldo/keto reductase [Sedimentisphaerales bacterium]|nr:aldo/keto reductase [Sedimentisphaerales bacterium]
MYKEQITRRQFIRSTVVFAGGVLFSSLGGGVLAAQAKRTAVDQVALGKTGLKLSRLGIGTGSRGGSIQRALGDEGFNRLLRYAYDQGITYIDTAQNYRTHTMVREAIKGLPREKLFIQSKMPGVPEKPLEVLDQYRKELGVDYIDSVLSHCAVTKDWEQERKRVLDALEEAKDKKIIRAHGVSCHSLPALSKAAQLDWVDVNLVRVNPQGAHMDTPAETGNAVSDEPHVSPVLEQLNIMRRNRHGIIGMKIIGNGDFTRPEDREESIRFAMQPGLVDAVAIGFKSPAEIDEAIMRMNRALAETAQERVSI